MSLAKSAFSRSAALKHLLGISAMTMPAGCYLALYTTDPTINDSGIEVTGGSYARQNMASKWGTELDGQIANNASVGFTSMPACTVVGWGIRSAASGGNLIYQGLFELPIPVLATATFTIATGDIVVRER